MKIISFDKIANSKLDPLICYKWVEEVLKNKDKALLPTKISLKPNIEGVFYNTMPSILPYKDIAGVKLVTRYPSRNPSLDSQILLYRLSSGENLALIDGNWITAMRTGVVCAHSIKLFAKKDFSILGYIGLGNTARASLLTILSLYKDKKFLVKLKKYKGQEEEFAKRFKNFENAEFIYCDSYEEVIKGSHVVVSAATVFESDICRDECFDEGVLLVPIHTRGFTNCDLFFDKVYADDRDHVKDFKNFSKFKNFHETFEVLNGKAKARENDKERILVYNIGISLHDIFFAGEIYEILGNSCPSIDLNGPKEKFWL